jgi:uncharacterized membrane protein YhaH (DUF805 family)
MPSTVVTEIRVHGVGGSTPASLLDDPNPTLVSGDRIAGFYRSKREGDREVEAYSWGGLTSRSGIRVLWLFLLPFMLANLAGWMCAKRLHDGRRLWFWIHRWLVRWAGLALTLNLLLVTAMITMDVVAYQCGGQESCTGAHWWFAPLRWLEQFPGRRVALGAAIPLVLIVVLAWLARDARQRYESVPPPAREGAQKARNTNEKSAAAGKTGLDGPNFWNGVRATSRLATVHLSASLAMLALIVAHTAHTTVTERHLTAEWRPAQLVAWVLAVAVLVVSLVLIGYDEYPNWTKYVLLGCGVSAVAAAIAHAWAQPGFTQETGHLPGMRWPANIGYASVLVPVFLMALFLAVRGIGALVRRRQNPTPTFRWGAPFVVLGLAVALLNAVTLGALILITDVLGTPEWTLDERRAAEPNGQATIAIYPVIGTAAPWLTLAPLGLTLLFGLYQLVRYVLAGLTDTTEVTADYTTDPEPVRPNEDLARWNVSALPDRTGDDPYAKKVAKRWVRRTARMRRLAAATTGISYLLTAMTVLGICVVISSEVRIWVFREFPVDWSVGIGTLASAIIPTIAITVMRSGWRDIRKRRLLGVLWDVGTFFPRAYHPLAPPCYTERAVPELQRRIWYLHDSGHRILLKTHSQGTIVAAAALLQQDQRARDDKIALLTFGSPLAKLYGWGFPAYFSPDVLTDLHATRKLVDWRNHYYRTDYIGGPVGIAVVDRPLCDPSQSWYVYGQPPPRIRSHTGYWSDPAVQDSADHLANRVATAGGAPDRG